MQATTTVVSVRIDLFFILCTVELSGSALVKINLEKSRPQGQSVPIGFNGVFIFTKPTEGIGCDNMTKYDNFRKNITGTDLRRFDLSSSPEVRRWATAPEGSRDTPKLEVLETDPVPARSEPARPWTEAEQIIAAPCFEDSSY